MGQRYEEDIKEDLEKRVQGAQDAVGKAKDMAENAGARLRRAGLVLEPVLTPRLLGEAASESVSPPREKREEQQQEAKSKSLELRERISELEEQGRKMDEALDAPGNPSPHAGFASCVRRLSHSVEGPQLSTPAACALQLEAPAGTWRSKTLTAYAAQRQKERRREELLQLAQPQWYSSPAEESAPETALERSKSHYCQGHRSS